MLAVIVRVVLVAASLISAAVMGLALFNALTMRRIAGIRPDLDEWPTLSIVIPARDEQDTLETALRSKLGDDYPNLEVVLVDDRSVDGTGEIARRIAAEDPRLRVVRIEELPGGWLGKVHALQRGFEASTGELVLFSDADVHLAPGTMRRVVALCERERFDLLAVMPQWKPAGFWVDALIGWFTAFIHVPCMSWAIENPRVPFAIGVGAFNLVRRRVFERSEGFEWLRMETADDVGMGVLMKRAGAHCTIADGRGAVSVTLYPDMPAAYRGVEKNAASIGGGSLPRGIVFSGTLLLFDFAPLGLVLLGGPLAVLGGAVLAAHTAVELTLVWRNGRQVVPALLWPVASLLFASLLLRSTAKSQLAGGVQWRDTFYTTEELREGQRVRVG